MALAPTSTPALPNDPSKDLLITSASYSAETGEVTLRWNSELSFEYQVEASPNLTDWQVITPKLPAQSPSTSHTFADTAVAESDKRFYRIVLFP